MTLETETYHPKTFRNGVTPMRMPTETVVKQYVGPLPKGGRHKAPPHQQNYRI